MQRCIHKATRVKHKSSYYQTITQNFLFLLLSTHGGLTGKNKDILHEKIHKKISTPCVQVGISRAEKSQNCNSSEGIKPMDPQQK